MNIKPYRHIKHCKTYSGRNDDRQTEQQSKRTNEKTPSTNRMGEKRICRFDQSYLKFMLCCLRTHLDFRMSMWLSTRFSCRIFPFEHFLTHKYIYWNIRGTYSHHVISFIRPSIRSTQISFENLFGFIFLFSTINPCWKKDFAWNFRIDFSFNENENAMGKIGVWEQIPNVFLNFNWNSDVLFGHLNIFVWNLDFFCHWGSQWLTISLCRTFPLSHSFGCRVVSNSLLLSFCCNNF